MATTSGSRRMARRGCCARATWSPTTVEVANARRVPLRSGAAVLPGTLRRRLSRGAGCVRAGGARRGAGEARMARTGCARCCWPTPRSKRRAPGARCGRRRYEHADRTGDGQPGALPLEELLRTAAELGIETLEFGCGNWSPAPHVDLRCAAGVGSGARRRSWAHSRRTGWRSAR